MADNHGRKTVIDLLPEIKERIYPVGRLDYDTRGLLLLTNDGEFANLMTHPRYQITKVYHVWCQGRVGRDEIKQLQRGILLDGTRTLPARVKVLKQTAQNALLEIKLQEGRKRQIKRIMSEVGHSVLELKRVSLGVLTLQGVPEGEYRFLSLFEVEHLKRQAKQKRLTL